jgi:3-oxoacyl-[acyl-carrier-protein] synthase-1
MNVFIVGVGARTSVGMTAASSSAAVRAGISAFAEHPYMVDRAGEPMIVAKASYVPDEATGVERLAQLARPAALEALEVLRGLPGGTMPWIPLVVGLPAERPGLPASFDEVLAANLTQMLREFNSSPVVKVTPVGHAAGLIALEAGWENITNGRTDFCLAGGVDAYFAPDTLEWLDEQEQLHSTRNSWGFVPGEAAGFCLLASERAVRQYGLNALGRLLAVATEREEKLIKTATVCTGQGLSAAFRQVLPSLPAPDVKVDQIISDMNGEPYRADEFAFTMLRTSKHFARPGEFQTPADCWGDVGAASGPLFAVLAIAANSRGYSKGPYNLLWASSEGGQRSAALLYTEQAEGAHKNLWA